MFLPYKSISFSDFKQRYNQLEKIKKNIEKETLSDKVYFGIIYAEYDIFNPDIKMDEVLKKTKKGTLRLRKKKKQVKTEGYIWPEYC